MDAIESGLEPRLKSFGKGFTILEREVEDVATEVVEELKQEEEVVSEELKKEAEAAARLIRRFQMEAQMGVIGKWVQGLPLSVREFIMPMP